ncbi:MAG: hypothetical protein ABW187_01590 [Dokdonella sp.]
MRLAQFLAFLEIGLRRRQRIAAGRVEASAESAGMAAFAFGRFEPAPFGLRLAHARRDRVRMQSADGQRFDVCADLLPTLIVGPALPLAELGIALLDHGKLRAERTRQRLRAASAQSIDSRFRRMRLHTRAGVDRLFQRRQGLFDFFDQRALPLAFDFPLRVDRIERCGEACLREQRSDRRFFGWIRFRHCRVDRQRCIAEGLRRRL